MTTRSRLESYVEERIVELAANRRAKLQSTYDEEARKIGIQWEKYVTEIASGVNELVHRIVKQAETDGCAIGDVSVATKCISKCAISCMKETLGLKAAYDYDANENLWPEGTQVRKAQDALRAFDLLCEKEMRRIVVYKKDLGMKPEAFEKMLAETAIIINKE